MKLLTKLSFPVNLVLIFSLLLSSCQISLPGTDKDVLYLNIIWHQHQPLYYADADGIITRPWVRVHATKDYYDMAATVAKYPDVHVTFNLTPVLLMQMDQFVNDGVKDKYWVLAEKPAVDLTDADRQFILTRFFDANWDHMIRVHPGYKRLLDLRGGTAAENIQAAMTSFNDQDFRDLQIWFNLAWMDPDLLESDPLKALVAKDHDFNESDKVILFDEVKRVMAQVVPIHKELMEKGQIEVITSPLAHPILPLLYDTELALVGNPNADMPRRFQYVQDDIAQLSEGRAIYKENFGREPTGLWPSEGSVAEQVVPLVSNAGYQWMASGEQVLANSLGIGAFTRNNNDTVLQADQFYRPYWVSGPADGPIKGGKVLMVFRDNLISDKLGFTYSGTPGEEAAADFTQRMENIRQQLITEEANGPHLVSIILDGENAWENYDRDGKDFLNALYRKLSESKTIKTVTVNEYLKKFPNQQDLPELFPGAWFSANYDTWIGEPEEKAAWNLLGQVRGDLEKVILEQKKSGQAVPGLDEATRQMYLAEGSDWFWWYGADQDSGNDAYFDEGYRALLSNVYKALGKEVPLAVQVPIIPAQVAKSERDLNGQSIVNVDATASPEEWDAGAVFNLVTDPPVSTLQNLQIGVDQQNLYLSLLSDEAWNVNPDRTIEVYLSSPYASRGLGFSRPGEGSTAINLLGFSATHLMTIHPGGGQMEYYTAGKQEWQQENVHGQMQAGDTFLEVALPLEWMGGLQAGDEVKVRLLADGAVLPSSGPARVLMPDLSNMTTILQVTDPTGDDNGPGTYTYPTDTVFGSGVFDITGFKVRYDEENISFDFTIAGDITNPWNGPAGFSLQTFDVYIDQDPGTGTGAQLLLSGRNASLSEGSGWEYALWAESWTPQILAPDAVTKEPKPVNGASFKVVLNPAARTVSLIAPRSIFGDGDPSQWTYAGMVLSQEGYPAEGVWRVRDVEPAGAQWRIGGAPDDANHTRILDLAWPEGQSPDQAEQLSTYTSSSDPAAGDYPKIQMLAAN